MVQLNAADLQRLFDAFNRHDIEAVMAFFANDIVFETASGSGIYGDRVEGYDAVAAAFTTFGPRCRMCNGAILIIKCVAIAQFPNGRLRQRAMMVSASSRGGVIYLPCLMVKSSANKRFAKIGHCSIPSKFHSE